jgi:ATP-binding dynein motor region
VAPVGRIVWRKCCLSDASAQPNGRKVLRLGDREIDWDDSFRLYMTSKLPNPRYGPEVSGKTAIINYSVTEQVKPEDRLARLTQVHCRALRCHSV